MNSNISKKTSSYLSQIIYRINLISSYQDLTQKLSEYLDSLISYDSFFIVRVAEQPDHSLSDYDLVTDKLYSAADEDGLGNIHSRDYWTKYLQAPWSSVYRISAVEDRTTWERSFLYNHYYKPLELYDSLQAVFTHNTIKLGAICLYRRKSSGNFTDSDIRMMELLKPHIELKLFRLLNREKGFTLEPDPLAPRFVFSNTNAQQYGLTRREEEITRRLLLGETDAQLYKQLCITKSTLDKHIHNIYKKTGARSRITLFQLFKT